MLSHSLQAEYEKDKHSRSQPAGSSGPNKEGAARPTGASVLGTEMGAESDARRERQQAVAEGDKLPPANTDRTSAGALGFGQSNGADAGVPLPSGETRQNQQKERNAEANKSVPNLAKIAQTSNASGAHNAQADPQNVTSSGQTNPSDMLGRVGKSAGQPSGVGAFNGEVTGGAPTNA